jgi:hypothetical protein
MGKMMGKREKSKTKSERNSALETQQKTYFRSGILKLIYK